LFFGLLSFKYLAARISAAKKIRWVVHLRPLAMGCKRDLRRLR
jgi:hypothetical protein